MRGSRRAESLTQRLLAFSRQTPLSPKPMDIGRLVGSLSDLLRRTLGEQVTVETVLGGGLWRASVDPNQLEVAIIDLAVNGRDAMPQGGKLTLETANVYLDESYAASQVEVVPGQYIVVAVTDTGKGMTADVLTKAFDPPSSLQRTSDTARAWVCPRSTDLPSSPAVTSKSTAKSATAPRLSSTSRACTPQPRMKRSKRSI